MTKKITAKKLTVIGILVALTAGMIGLNHIQNQPRYTSESLSILEANGPQMIQDIRENRQMLSGIEDNGEILDTISETASESPVQDQPEQPAPAHQDRVETIWITSGFTYDENGRNVISLTWDAPAGEISGYQVMRNDGTVWSVKPGWNSLVDSFSEPGNIYTYDVRAFNSQGITARGSRVHIFPPKVVWSENQPLERDLQDSPETQLNVTAHSKTIGGQSVVIVDWDQPSAEVLNATVFWGVGNYWATLRDPKQTFVIHKQTAEAGMHHYLVVVSTVSGYLTGQATAEIGPQSSPGGLRLHSFSETGGTK